MSHQAQGYFCVGLFSDVREFVKCGSCMHEGSTWEINNIEKESCFLTLWFFSWIDMKFEVAGRDLWDHLLQSLPKQGSPQQSSQAHIQAAFGNLRGRVSTAWWQLALVLWHLCSKELFSSTKMCKGEQEKSRQSYPWLWGGSHSIYPITLPAKDWSYFSSFLSGCSVVL